MWKKTILALSIVLGAGCVASNAGEFSPAADPAQGCPADFFSQKAVVFDAITICATHLVDPEKFVARGQRGSGMAG